MIWCMINGDHTPDHTPYISAHNPPLVYDVYDLFNFLAKQHLKTKHFSKCLEDLLAPTGKRSYIIHLIHH